VKVSARCATFDTAMRQKVTPYFSFSPRMSLFYLAASRLRHRAGENSRTQKYAAL